MERAVGADVDAATAREQHHSVRHMGGVAASSSQKCDKTQGATHSAEVMQCRCGPRRGAGI